MKAPVPLVFTLLAASACVACSVASSAQELRDGQVHIALRADIAVANARVTLGDIAVLHTRDLPTIQRLAALPIGRVAGVQTEAVVHRAALVRWLRNQLGIGEEQVQWSGPQEARVRLLSQELSGSRLQGAAEAALRNWLAPRTSRYELQALPIVADLSLPPGPVALEVRPFAANARPAQRMLVWVDVQVDGRFMRAVPVSFRVEAYRQGWVALAAVSAHVDLVPGLVVRRELKFTELAEAGSRMNQAAWPTGLRTTKAVGEGETISARNVAPAPMVARGEWVLLRLKSGQVEVERRAQVMQDGSLGQVVQVRSPGGSAPIAARVTASGKVEATL
jgi:flagella basal body P-ring formation protein FlgA